MITALFLIGFAATAQADASAPASSHCIAHTWSPDRREALADCSLEAIEHKSATLVWLERNGEITEQVPAERDAVRSLLADPHWLLAGRGVVAGRDHPPGTFIRWFDAEEKTKSLFRREAGEGAAVVLPVGRAVAVAYEPPSTSPVAISLPVRIASHAQATARFHKPKGADVLVIARRPESRQRVAAPVRLALSRDSVRVEPDVFVETPDEVLALWYDAPPGAAKLELTSTKLWLPDDSLRLRAGSATILTPQLRSLPNVEVTIRQEGKETRLPPMTLTAAVAGKTAILTSREAEANHSYRFEDLPLQTIEITLHIGDWSFKRLADLRSGSDGTVTFALEPLVVRGVVREDEQPAAAEVAFLSDERWVKTRTDDDGKYETTLWMPARYIVRAHVLADEGVPPYEQTVRVVSDMEFDIDLPSRRFTAVVTDEATGDPIEGAKVVFTFRGEDRGRAAAVVTAADGKAVLPPLLLGHLSLVAYAKGYTASPRQEIEITETAGAQAIEFRLRKEETLEVHVDVDGKPAAGAELVPLLPDGTPDASRQMRTTGDGSADLPLSARGLTFLVRHATAASALCSWIDLEARRRCDLHPARGNVSVMVRRAGDQPLRPGFPAEVRMWIGGTRLTPSATAFAAWTTATTDNSGLWTGRNLPPGINRLLATVRLREAAVQSGAYDSLATTFAIPAAGQLTIEARE